MRRWMFALSALVGTASVIAACGVGSDCDFGLCAGPPVVGPEGGADGDVPPPAGCDPKVDPKDAPACVVNEYGVFVSPTGTKDAPGTKEAPVDSIGTALAKRGNRPRVYVCEGAYEERVELKSAVSLYGGFACADWKHTGARAVIGKAQEAGFALDVRNVVGAFEVADLEFFAANGTEALPNSIAARFVSTSGAVLRRVKLTAGNGFDGKAGAAGAAGSSVTHTDVSGAGPYDPTGNPGTTTSAGGSKSCKCPNAPASDATIGGAGGGATTGGGQEGEPKDLPATGPGDTENGAGGESSAIDCGLGGGSGHKGATRVQGTGGAAGQLGSLLAETWNAGKGGDGSNGLFGEGGGGGSGQSLGGGSGGGCGGCGGFGGKGGDGGGASVGVLAIDSPLRVAAEMVTGKGGRGGAGGDGGDGGDGGFGGARTSGNGCNGGDGGKGGKGGAGAGGAGGVSIGVLFSGASPITDGTTFTLGDAGNGGIGLQSNSGRNGVKAERASVETLSSDGGS